MRLITRQLRANETAKNWAAQYQSDHCGQDKIKILEKLEALGDTPAPDEVNKVIGNKLWTRTKCDECGAENVNVVEMGEEPYYESRSVEVCKDCLAMALAMPGLTERIMEFVVKLIEVTETKDQNSRDDLYANCCHVAKDYWLFEGDAESLNEGIKFNVVGEEAIECYGDLSSSEIKRMVCEIYNVDKCFIY